MSFWLLLGKVFVGTFALAFAGCLVVLVVAQARFLIREHRRPRNVVRLAEYRDPSNVTVLHNHRGAS